MTEMIIWKQAVLFMLCLLLWPYAVHEPIHWAVGNAVGDAKVHYKIMPTAEGLARPYVSIDYRNPTHLKVWLFMFLPLAVEAFIIMLIFWNRATKLFGLATYLIVAILLQVTHIDALSDLRFIKIFPLHFILLSVVWLLVGFIAYLLFAKDALKDKI